MDSRYKFLTVGVPWTKSMSSMLQRDWLKLVCVVIKKVMVFRRETFCFVRNITFALLRKCSILACNIVSREYSILAGNTISYVPFWQLIIYLEKEYILAGDIIFKLCSILAGNIVFRECSILTGNSGIREGFILADNTISRECSI